MTRHLLLLGSSLLFLSAIVVVQQSTTEPHLAGRRSLRGDVHHRVLPKKKKSGGSSSSGGSGGSSGGSGGGSSGGGGSSSGSGGGGSSSGGGGSGSSSGGFWSGWGGGGGSGGGDSSSGGSSGGGDGGSSSGSFWSGWGGGGSDSSSSGEGGSTEASSGGSGSSSGGSHFWDGWVGGGTDSSSGADYTQQEGANGQDGGNQAQGGDNQGQNNDGNDGQANNQDVDNAGQQGQYNNGGNGNTESGTTKFGEKISDFFSDMGEGIKKQGEDIVKKGDDAVKDIRDSPKGKFILIALVVSFAVTFIIGLIAICLGYHYGCCGICCLPAGQKKEDDTVDLAGEPTADYIIHSGHDTTIVSVPSPPRHPTHSSSGPTRSPPATERSPPIPSLAMVPSAVALSNMTPLIQDSESNDSMTEGVTFDDETQVYGNLPPIDERPSAATWQPESEVASQVSFDKHSVASSIHSPKEGTKGSLTNVAAAPSTLDNCIKGEGIEEATKMIETERVHAPVADSAKELSASANVKPLLITKKYSASSQPAESEAGQYHKLDDDTADEKAAAIAKDLETPPASKQSPEKPVNIDMKSVAGWKPAEALRPIEQDLRPAAESSRSKSSTIQAMKAAIYTPKKRVPEIRSKRKDECQLEDGSVTSLYTDGDASAPLVADSIDGSQDAQLSVTSTDAGLDGGVPADRERIYEPPVLVTTVTKTPEDHDNAAPSENLPKED